MKLINAFFDKIYNLFLWSSGADLKILDQAPMEKNKYYGIGGTIVFTALMASFAGGYAFYTAFQSEIPSVLFGFFWGALIFNLDRYIVSSFGIGDGRKTIAWQELIDAAPRLVMAVILGFVIATPLELKLFEREITAEITRLNDKTASELSFNIKAQIDSTSQIFIKEKATYEDDIEERRKYLDQLRIERDKSYEKYMCELNGTCGTGKPGEGPVFREVKENYIRLNGEFHRLEVAYRELNTRDFEEIKLRDNEIAELRLDGTDRKARLDNEYESRDGLLARLEALGTLTSSDNSLWAAKWLITILFVFIEIAPILFKMMTERGPYDDILDQKKYEIKVQQMLAQSNINEVINMEVKINAEKSAQKLEAELLANTLLLKTISQAQAEIASAAIEEWKKKQIEIVKNDPSIIITNSLN